MLKYINYTTCSIAHQLLSNLPSNTFIFKINFNGGWLKKLSFNCQYRAKINIFFAYLFKSSPEVLILQVHPLSNQFNQIQNANFIIIFAVNGKGSKKSIALFINQTLFNFMAFADQSYQQNSKEILTPNIDTNMKQELSNDTVHVWAHLLPGQVYELLSSEVKSLLTYASITMQFFRRFCWNLFFL